MIVSCDWVQTRRNETACMRHVTMDHGPILELVQVQPPTKRPFPARDLHNGYPNQVLAWL